MLFSLDYCLNYVVDGNAIGVEHLERFEDTKEVIRSSIKRRRTDNTMANRKKREN
jgi:hypothetical protein